MFVGYVVCEFQFVEADNFLHPLLPSGRTVRVDVHPLGHLGVRLACHDPSAVVELVSEVVRSHHVQQQDVLGLGVQAGHFKLHLWKHLPRNKIFYSLKSGVRCEKC